MMLDPLLTNVLRRRIGASILDLGVIGLIGGAASIFRAEKFTPQTTDPSTGEVIWSSADNARLGELSGDSLNRMAQLGDTQYIWSRDELVVIALIVALAVAAVFVLLPSVSQSTIGQRIFHLRTSDLKGRPATTSQHFVRTFGGLVDLFPFVIPGLLGWAVASRSQEKQRIGDKLAKTTVIDAKGAVRLLSEQELGQRRDSASSSSRNDDSMIDLGDRLGSTETAIASESLPENAEVSTETPHALDGISLGMELGGASTTAPVLPGVEASSIPLARTEPEPLPSPSSAPVAPIDATLSPGVDQSWMTETPGHPTSPLTQSGWVPVTRDDAASTTPPPTQDSPTPQTPTDLSALDAAISGVDPIRDRPSPIANTGPSFDDSFSDRRVTDRRITDSTTSDSTTSNLSAEGRLSEGLADQPMPIDVVPDSLPIASQGHLPAVEATENATEPEHHSSSTLLPPPPLHRAASWQQPVAEPAPVWTPDVEGLSTDPGQQEPSNEVPLGWSPTESATSPPVTDPARHQSGPAQSHAGSDALTTSPELAPSTDTQTDFSVAESGPTGVNAIDHDTSPDAATETDGPSTESDPRWDEDWQAWIYWDATHSAWLRHDVDSDSWIPLG